MTRFLFTFIAVLGVAAASRAAEPIKLEVDVRDAPQRMENGDFVSTAAVNYKGGARFPKLERTMAEPDLIRDIIKPGRM